MRINNMLVASYLYDHRSLRGRKTLSHPPAGVPAITLYTYDPNGHLFQEIAGSGPNAGQALVTYLWQDDVPAAIVLGPNTPGNPSAQDKLLYLEVDHLNTPRIARDEQKRVVWRWDSDAFGNTAPNEDPDGAGIKTTINLRFPGQYFDAESGLHYNWHRYYDPQVGRYTQPDPIGVEGGVNPYAYVAGNPLSFTDPKGLTPATPAAIALCAANIPLCAATAAATCWAYEPCRQSLIDGGKAICKAAYRASDDADRCKQRLVTCRQQCQAKWERGDSPFSGSDTAGRMRRCIRECMEAGGCFNF